MVRPGVLSIVLILMQMSQSQTKYSGDSSVTSMIDTPKLAARFLILSAVSESSSRMFGHINTLSSMSQEHKERVLLNCLTYNLETWHYCSRAVMHIGHEPSSALKTSIRMLLGLLRGNESASPHMDLAVRYMELGHPRLSAYHSRRSIMLGGPSDAWLNLATALDAVSHGIPRVGALRPSHPPHHLGALRQLDRGESSPPSRQARAPCALSAPTSTAPAPPALGAAGRTFAPPCSRRGGSPKPRSRPGTPHHVLAHAPLLPQ